MYRSFAKVRGDKKFRNTQTQLKAPGRPEKAENKSLCPAKVKAEP